ncbi:MAG: family 43 glycosylhydrolase [Clostridia bacterium]|nr:family 43 glycosylhydrolase [Clostridia bacterium]
MQLKDIYIRDPYIFPYCGVYYMYGKERADAVCFCVYKSRDLKEWDKSLKVFVPPAGFWATEDYWAPEVHEYKGRFYMFASFKAPSRCRATQILVSDAPDGCFVPLTDHPVTPPEWECLDGTLYTDKNGRPHIVFCHEWTQIGNGTVCEMELSADLKTAVSTPRLLWSASDYSGVVDARNDTVSKVTDGPFLHRLKSGELIAIWSSFNKNGYAVLIARSDNGDVDGIWTVDSESLIDINGGHGMVFNTFSGKTMLVMHRPNENPYERAVLLELKEDNGRLSLQ